MKQKFKTLLLVLVLPYSIYCQNLTYEDIYEINTKLAISSVYKSSGKLNCAIEVLKQLDSNYNFISKSNYTSRLNFNLAECYLNKGDSNLAEKYFLKTLNFNSPNLISEIALKNSPYNYIYLKNKTTLDSLYLSFLFNEKLQKKLAKNKEKMFELITKDQFVRTELSNMQFNKIFSFSKDSIVSAIWTNVDSLNTNQLLKMIEEDKECYIAKFEFTNFYILNLHLSRYDTAVLKKLFEYNEKCLGKANYLNAIILENRFYSKYGIQPLRTYLMQENFSDKLNFESIDKERRKYGLPSLFFDILSYKMQIPNYYKSFHKKFFSCNDVKK